MTSSRQCSKLRATPRPGCSAPPRCGPGLIGRAIGFTVAHEILHGLLGFEIPTGHHDPAIPGDIMNPGSDLGITDRTGIVVTDNTNFPAPGSFDDQGFAAMARVTATTQAVIDRFFPVPPAF